MLPQWLLLLVYLAFTDVRISGQQTRNSTTTTLGTVGVKTSQSTFIYRSQFYLDIQNPANASGMVSNIAYCFSVRDTTLPRYQASVGFYRRDGRDFFLVSESYSISLNPSSLFPKERYCKQLQITPVEIQKGDMFGLCSRDFSDVAGHLQISAIGLRTENTILKSGDNSDLNRICPEIGVMASTLSNHELERSRSVLRMFSNITVIIPPTPGPTVTFPLTTDTRTTQKLIFAESLFFEETSTSNLGLISSPAKLRVIIGGVLAGFFLLLLFLLVVIITISLILYLHHMKTKLPKIAVTKISLRQNVYLDNNVAYGVIHPGTSDTLSSDYNSFETYDVVL